VLFVAAQKTGNNGKLKNVTVECLLLLESLFFLRC